METMQAYIDIVANRTNRNDSYSNATEKNSGNMNSIDFEMISQLSPTSDIYKYANNCADVCFPQTKACCPGFFCPLLRPCMLPCQQDGSWCPSSDTVK